MVSDNLLIEARQYLRHILDSGAVSGAWAKPWSEAKLMPFFLQTPYSYHLATLFGQPCLLMRAGTPEGETPAVVRKHWQAVSQRFSGNVIYLVEMVSSYNRKRLIEQRVPFLIPGKQLYLPPLGVDLREFFTPGRQVETSHLSAPAQGVLLRQILSQDCAGQPGKDVARMLGYSPMTITRAINELTDHGLAIAEKVGREKHLQFPSSGRTLWEAAQPLLQSPVTRRVMLVPQDRETWKLDVEGRIAGDSALAHYTDLADTGIRQWAVTSDALSTLSKHKGIKVLANLRPDEVSHLRTDRELIELEVWAYHPDVTTPGKAWVDPLSLWLSFAQNTDERIEIALDALLAQTWSS